ncbi:GH3 auxin-responsive promoter family protein [Aquirufa sp. ROCK-SH2]
MSLFNETLLWLMKKRMPRIEAMYTRPHELQELCFFDLLAQAQHTEWGRMYGYGLIKNYQQFKSTVPISTYEEIFPYIERMMKGEEQILWPTPISWFSKSSGTTNARSKFIPVSKESLGDCHLMGGKDMITLLVNNKPETKVFEGKGLSIGGSLASNPMNSSMLLGDVSAVVMKNLPIWAQLIRTPSLDVALMDDWDQKIEKMALVTSQENVTSILGVPTWTLVLIEKILEITGKKSILEVWENFEFMIHGAVAFGPYREMFKKEVFQGLDVGFLEIYNASEGFFGIQDDLSLPDELLLMLDYGIFYEFIPLNEEGEEANTIVPLWEVELGINYALVISTNAGLWRYKIGDTVRFTSKFPYRIKITGRTKHFINAFGEELIIDNAEQAIAKACYATSAELKEYTAAPSFMEGGKSGNHEWVIEFSKAPKDFRIFAEMLDQTLRELNSDYDAKRSYNLVLGPPIIHQAPTGTFYAWMKERGKLGGQHKVPRLSNHREFIEGVKSHFKP